MHSNFQSNFEQDHQPYQPLILIIDNDMDNLLFASCIIEALGMNYAVTNNSEECLDLVYKFLPDIILLDIVMPKINGLEITRTIKQDDNIAYIPIIAVTGLTKREHLQELTAAGCEEYLRKPYLIEELEAKVYSCLKCHLIEVQK